MTNAVTPTDMQVAEAVFWAANCFGSDHKCADCDARSECAEGIMTAAIIIALDRARERETAERTLKAMAEVLRNVALAKGLETTYA